MRTRDASVVYLVLEVVTALLHATAWTTAAVYLINTAHLGPLQLVLLGTVMEASVLVFELPTGVVADTVSRRRSVLIGVLLMGLAFVLTGAIPRFPALLASQALWGLGYTFTSGATQAWLAGEVGEGAAGPLFLRAAQYGRVGAAAGIGLSVGLANLALGLPLVVAGLAAARRDRVLLALLLVALFAGMSTEGIDRLWELHLLREVGFPALGHLGPVTWFGIIELATLVLGAAVIAPVRRRVDTGDPVALCWLLLVLTAVEVATLVAFGLAGGFGVAVAAPGVAIVAAGAALVPVAVVLGGVQARALRARRSLRRTPGR
jgi:DHA3 family tetracycline resistance protein-like MFS transporter